MEARVDPVLRDLLPPLSTPEREALAASIEADGVRDPILIDEDGVILDGHHRHAIALELNVPTEFRVIAGLSVAQKRATVLASNFRRRNLSPDQKAELRTRQIEIAAALKEEGQTQEQIALVLGVARETVRDWLMPNGGDAKMHKVDSRVKVTAKQKEEVVERVDAGEPQTQIAADLGVNQSQVSRIHKAEVKKKKRAEETGRLTEQATGTEPVPGAYQCIVIDPPWEMTKIERDERPNQAGFDYQTMSVAELSNPDCPKWNGQPVTVWPADNCHLYLWTTQKHLPHALNLAGLWGFEYQCLMTWVKNVGFTPFSWMYSTEHVLFCRKGSLPLLRNGLRLDFAAKVREHSRKPDEFYEIVRQASPGPRIDVFSRGGHEGFDVWGNQTGMFDA